MLISGGGWTVVGASTPALHLNISTHPPIYIYLSTSGYDNELWTNDSAYNVMAQSIYICNDFTGYSMQPLLHVVGVVAHHDEWDMLLTDTLPLLLCVIDRVCVCVCVIDRVCVCVCGCVCV